MTPRRGPVSAAYRRYVLCVLFLVYVFNFIDRQILSILVVPIQHDLGVSDFVMGLLGGTAFALFYCTAGIPIARWADLGVRRNVIAISLAAWSGMTALCGSAQTAAQLALFRVGVGVGEAGGSPPSHSLVADYFPPAQRARALSFISMGMPVGILFGLLAGSQLESLFGSWRAAFVAVGAPGLVLALLVRTTVREPERGATEATPAGAPVAPFREILPALLALRSFRSILLAGPLAAFSGYSFGYWGAAFFERVHGLARTEIGWKLGIATALGGALGMAAGGVLADVLGRRDVRNYARLCAVSLAGTLPLGAVVLYADAPGLAFAAAVPFLFAGAMYTGPMFAIVQGVAPLRARATASAILLLVNNLIGLGVGPPAVGLLNDALSSELGNDGVRHALMAATLVNVLAIALFLRCARDLRSEMQMA